MKKKQSVQDFNLLTRKRELVTGAIQIMLSAQGKKQFTVVSLAEQLGTNETTLKQAFKAVMQTSIYAWFLQYRMNKAIYLMKQGANIGYIAAAIGYSHAAHFSAAFRKIYGMAPHVYARSMQKNSLLNKACIVKKVVPVFNPC